MTLSLPDDQLFVGLGKAFDAYQPRIWSPLPYQIPPAGRWRGWLLLAGRGTGKTDTCAHYMCAHANGPPCLPPPSPPHWMGIIGPTLGDAATSAYAGPTGIRAHDPTTRLVTKEGGTVVVWPNGAEAKLFGANGPDDVERLRSGGNRCLMWLEELAAWRYLQAAFDQMLFGLRAGTWPHWIGSTTPKPRELIKNLHDGKVANVAVTTGVSTDDNPHLPEDVRKELTDRYSGTALGGQELHGRIIDQDQNALWQRQQIEQFRLATIDVGVLRRITVGVDPSGGAGEQGIVVAGRAGDMGYVLADYSCHRSPEGWGDQVVAAATDLGADDICVEVNFGGDMAMSTIAAAAKRAGLPIPIRKVTASRGKRVRAEPVSAIAAHGRLPHVGTFAQLEDQLCTWVPGESDYSPDRLDALVWAVTHLGLVPAVASTRAQWAGAALARRDLTARR